MPLSYRLYPKLHPALILHILFGGSREVNFLCKLYFNLNYVQEIKTFSLPDIYDPRKVCNAVSAHPCIGKIEIFLVLLNFLDCNFDWWFETPLAFDSYPYNALEMTKIH